MGWLFVISSNDAETVFNAVRLANVSLKAGKEVNLFMLGKGVEFNEIGTPEFDVTAQVTEFHAAGGELIVWGVCLKSRGQTGSAACPMGFMTDLFEMIDESERVLTF